MKRKFIYCVRIVGRPDNRRYLLQRSDGKFWGGDAKWVAEQNQALVYRTIGDAQDACRPFIARQTRGKPVRQFVCTLVVNVIGDDAGPVTAHDVADYLTKTMVVGIDYEVPHDGPLADLHVEARAVLGGMREVAGGGPVRRG